MFWSRSCVLAAVSLAGATAIIACGGGGTPRDAEIDAAGKQFGQSTFSGTYTVADTSDPTQDGTLVLEKDGDSKFRMEVTTKQEGVDTTIIFIETSDLQAFCLKDAGELGALIGVEQGKGVCFKTSPTDQSNPVGSIRDSLKDFENANVSVIEKSNRTIAGQDGRCFKTKDNDTADVTTTCFAADGAMLYVKTEGDSASEIEARSINKNVNADDFKLPYEEKELPGGLGIDATP